MNLLKYCEQVITDYTKMKNWIAANADKLALFGDKVQVLGCSQIDINSPTRDEVLLAIKTWPGTWTKSTSAQRMHYELVVDGVNIRCWNTELPPSCHLETEVVLIPEHKEERYVVKCHGANQDLLATASEPQ